MVIAFPGCVYLEIAHAVSVLSRAFRVIIATPDGLPVRVEEGFSLMGDCSYTEAPKENLKCVLIPGGDIYDVKDSEILANICQNAHKSGAVIGGICNGALLITMSGILNHRQMTHMATTKYAPDPEFSELLDYAEPITAKTTYIDEDVAVDERIVTAKPWAAIEFARRIALLCEVFDESKAWAWAYYQVGNKRANSGFASHQIEWARSIQAIAQNGLAFSKDVFDQERFQALQKIAGEMFAKLAGLKSEQVMSLLMPEKGYATPKIDVRAAVFKDEKILLIKERSDALWSMPGGWADIGLSPSQCVEKEVFEEAGLHVKATKLYACFDKLKHPHPESLFHSWKLFFICEIQSGELKTGIESADASFFDATNLPPLSNHRITMEQILLAFQHHRHQTLATCFD